MSKELTDRQKEILDFIESFIGINGFPPTYREIGKHFDIASTFGVKRHIDALVKKGFLSSESNSSRTLSLVQPKSTSESAANGFEIPVIGRVAAGFPILAEENIESTISVDQSFMRRNGTVFGLRVRGDSMINAGILEGDVVIVNQQNAADRGDIVVAMLGDEATLKLFDKTSDNKMYLVPKNDNYPIIDVNNREDFSIIGRVVGLFRSYN